MFYLNGIHGGIHTPRCVSRRRRRLERVLTHGNEARANDNIVHKK